MAVMDTAQSSAECAEHRHDNWDFLGLIFTDNNTQ